GAALRHRAATRARRFRIGLFYWWRHGRWPDLDHPRLFTEWVQWRKLHDDRASLAALTDKLYSKAFAAQHCGAELCVPTYWSGTKLPSVPPGPLPLMVKANHGCGQFRVVHSLDEWRRARIAARRWLGSAYGGWLDEGQYRVARRLILVEPLLGGGDGGGDDNSGRGGGGGGLPDDYKVYVFGGSAAIVQHHKGRGTRAHSWTQFDREWRWVGGAASLVPPPAGLERMIEAAERLGSGHDFIRVDFYEVEGRVWFGEFCLFPGSGLDPFEPIALDYSLGVLWAAARAS
ncbi:MAG: ATP-grasp fold amidoligase family protein, partial [Sphingomicrobium sp.]